MDTTHATHGHGEDDERTAECGSCGGSGGGLDPELWCLACRGTGEVERESYEPDYDGPDDYEPDCDYGFEVDDEPRWLRRAV